MIKRLLFIFIVLFAIVNVQAQGNTKPSSDQNTTYTTPEPEMISMAYPNPADAETKIDYNLPKETKEAKIIIRSLLGLVISEHKLESLNGTITIQTSDLTGGIYLYSLIINGDIKITRKLIVQH